MRKSWRVSISTCWLARVWGDEYRGIGRFESDSRMLAGHRARARGITPRRSTKQTSAADLWLRTLRDLASASSVSRLRRVLVLEYFGFLAPACPLLWELATSGDLAVRTFELLLS